MKKLIYGFLLAVASMTVVTSCTEEDVKPKSEVDANGGGGAIEEIKKS
jgi:hypothetical protein